MAVWLRKNLPIIAQGGYHAALCDHAQVYAFERRLAGQKLLVLNNFFATEIRITLPGTYSQGQVRAGFEPLVGFATGRSVLSAVFALVSDGYVQPSFFPPSELPVLLRIKKMNAAAV